MKKHTRIDSRPEARRRRYREILENFTLMSDTFMRNVFKKQECTEYVLQVIMNQGDLKVLEQVLQKDYKNLQGRSAVLDCVAQDAGGRQFNVEIQQDAEGASPRRARYHSGLMDMNTLNPGQDFDELPETYVIFITRDDTLGYGLPVYHVTRKIEEVGADFGDEAYILYVNAGTQEDTELGRLMHDFHCRRAEDMYSEILAERVRELKETQEGVDIMCREMDEIYREGQRYGEKRGEKRGEERGIKLGEKRGIKLGEKRGIKLGEKRGEERGIAKGKQEMAFSLLRMGMPVEEIAKAASVSVELVEKWLEKELHPVG